MSDLELEQVVVKTQHVNPVNKRKVIVNIDSISKMFDDGDTIDLRALKERKLVESQATYVKVLARGSLDKSLIIKVESFSKEAMKMIVLTGGEVIKVVHDV